METKKKMAVTALMFFLALTKVHGAICEALGDGDWSDPTNWSCGSVPACGDIIIIPEFITVNLDIQIDLDETNIPACSTATFIQIYGTLFFEPGQKMYLACGSVVEVMIGGSMIPGGGGSSNLLYICQNEEWQSSDGDISGYRQFGEPIPLASVFSEFNAGISGNSCNFNWLMESEEEIEYFTIEYSMDGKKWIVLLDVESVGDHNDRYRYENISVEKSIQNAVVYFKLTQTDKSGNKLELAIKSVKNDMSLFLSPNPINIGEKLNLTMTSDNQHVSVINFYNSMGKFIKSEIINVEVGFNKFFIDIEDLSKGIYLIKSPEQNSDQVLKLIVN